MRSMRHWLITTAHLENRLLFKDFEDFIVGMNYLAVLSFKYGIIVLAFILMSNHVHLVAIGRRDDIETFVTMWKSLYSKYLAAKYGVRDFLRRLEVDIRPVPEESEALERAVAYVQMNCVAANICTSPYEYPWGTGSTFFKVKEEKGMRLGDFSARARYKLLHCKTDVPSDWKVCEEGYVLPSSYVDVDRVELLFRTPKRMNYFLQSSSKAKQRMETIEDGLPAFRDQVISAALPDLCRSLFGKVSVKELSDNQLIELLRQLRFRFASNVNQIARVVGLTYARAAAYLDQV